MLLASIRDPPLRNSTPGTGVLHTSRKLAGVAVQAKPAASTASARALPLALLEPIVDPGTPFSTIKTLLSLAQLG